MRKNKCIIAKHCLPSNYGFFKYIHSKLHIFPILNVKKMDRQRKDKELTNLSTKYIYFTE